MNRKLLAGIRTLNVWEDRHESFPATQSSSTLAGKRLQRTHLPAPHGLVTFFGGQPVHIGHHRPAQGREPFGVIAPQLRFQPAQLVGGTAAVDGP